MMSNHHGKEFIGFMATGPPIGVPERVWMWVAAPKIRVDSEGRPWQAPYGLRKIEAKLQEAGFKAAIIDPDHLHKHLDTMKVLLIGHHDFFALGPPSSEWWMITGKEPVNRRSFRRLMESPAVRKAREKGVRIIVGGPAAWQWLWELEYWKKWGVDTVIDGEAERVIVDVVDKALKGEPLPDYIYVGPGESPSIEEIPVIRGASVNGLVEIMRGCPRGCKFCSVTLRPLRFIPLEKIKAEIEVNKRHGVRDVIYHSEDVLLYGADGVKPRPEPLLKLHELWYRATDGTLAWSHASLAAVKYAEENYKLISRIMGDYVLRRERFLGVEVGIETLSVNLARKVMPAKAAPYPAEKWPEIVEDAFAIMHDNWIIPAGTIILGLPGETPDDVMKTAEGLDRLRPYRSLIVPMFFVPMGVFKNRDWFQRKLLKPEHLEVMLKTLEHSLYWAEEMISKLYLRGVEYIPLKLGLKAVIAYIKWKTRRLMPKIKARLEAAMRA
ncbi:B12-binding domain-containing radical SAM protein [Hyperthermus butylicus]|nr:radical SAM protein [Hyperthermus butylicus]